MNGFDAETSWLQKAPDAIAPCGAPDEVSWTWSAKTKETPDLSRVQDRIWGLGLEKEGMSSVEEQALRVLVSFKHRCLPISGLRGALRALLGCRHQGPVLFARVGFCNLALGC